MRVKIQQKIAENKYLRFSLQALATVFGAFLMGIAFNSFFMTQNITPSGFSGLSTLISFWLAKAGVLLAPSIIYLIINALLFTFALKILGLKYAILTIIGLGAYTLSMQFANITAISNATNIDLLLYCVIGGALSGLGVGITYRSGGSTGGSDIIVAIVSKYLPKVREGQCTLIINIFVISLCVLTHGIQTAFYAIIIAIISTSICDMVLRGSKAVRSFYIICDKDQEIAERILQTFHRGVTKFDAEGMFSHKKKSMLLCLVTEQQARRMKQTVTSVEPSAFVFSTEVNEMLGEGFFKRQDSIRKNRIKNTNSFLKKQVKYVLNINNKKRAGKMLKQPKALATINLSEVTSKTSDKLQEKTK